MVAFCFSCGTPCRTQKELENHVKSCPNYLHDLGNARPASLGFSPPASSTQLINYHSLRFETDANLAAKRSGEVMWHDEDAIETATSMPESPSKYCKAPSTVSDIFWAVPLSSLSLLVVQRILTWSLTRMMQVVHRKTYLPINFLLKSLPLLL